MGSLHRALDPGEELVSFSSVYLTTHIPYGKLLLVRGRGVAANMRPCQGRDRGFEPRRSRCYDLSLRRKIKDYFDNQSK